MSRACKFFLSILDAMLNRTQFKNPEKPLNYSRPASSTRSLSPFRLSYLVYKPTDSREQVHDQPYSGQVVALLTQLNAFCQQQTHVRTRIYFPRVLALLQVGRAHAGRVEGGLYLTAAGVEWNFSLRGVFLYLLDVGSFHLEWR